MHTEPGKGTDGCRALGEIGPRTVCHNAKQAQEYADNEADAFTAAANGYVDRVITAEDTKSALTSAIEATSSKRVVTPAKKHVNFVY